jgi:hypothetical protein
MATYTGIGAAFGSFFGSNDLQDAYEQAIREYERYRQTADESLQGFRTKGNQTYKRFETALTSPEMSPDLQAMRQMFVRQMQSGLSPYAQTLLGDANRLLENRAISTGNLRSGAVTLQRAQLGERVVNDEFARATAVFDMLRKGDLAGGAILGNIALGYAREENDTLRTLGTAVAGLAGANIGKGVAEYNQAVALGSAVGGLFDKGEEYMKDYFSAGTAQTSAGPDNSGGSWTRNALNSWTGT